MKYVDENPNDLDIFFSYDKDLELERKAEKFKKREDRKNTIKTILICLIVVILYDFIKGIF